MSIKGKPRLIEFAYEFYLKNYGVVSIAEKKLIVFLASIQRNLERPRVNFFAKFIGLIPSNLFLQEELVFYLQALNFILNKNCYKDKKKSIFKKSETTGELILKNPRLGSYFATLSAYFDKKQVKTLRESISSEANKSGRDRIYNMDLIISRTIAYRRQAFRPPPIHVQIFKTLRHQPEGVVHVRVLVLFASHFVKKEYLAILENVVAHKTSLKFDEFVETLREVLQEHQKMDRNSDLLSLPESTFFLDPSNMQSPSPEAPSINLNTVNLTQEQLIDQVDHESERKFGRMFNLEKFRRAKLNRESHQLKIYFQENFYEFKNELINCFRKINHVLPKIQSSLKFLFSKMAENFDTYDYQNVFEFFISFYLVKKEIH